MRLKEIKQLVAQVPIVSFEQEAVLSNILEATTAIGYAKGWADLSLKLKGLDTTIQQIAPYCSIRRQ